MNEQSIEYQIRKEALLRQAYSKSEHGALASSGTMCNCSACWAFRELSKMNKGQQE